ncbi:hypothetical protein MMC14_007076 [Varicellaria rhodocarpa]|nr:hypothetical protein [Varicellaria rhodocarpa]
MTTIQRGQPVLDSYQAIISTFIEFLIVAIHGILYERNIYPRTSFLNARKYNYPVRQCRHPKVCRWIQDAALAVEGEMLKGTVSTTSLIIYSSTSQPLERFVFSTALFPSVPQSENFTPFLSLDDPDIISNLPPATSRESSTEQDPNVTPAPPPLPTLKINITDLEQQLRSLLTRLSTLPTTLSPLPPDCTFSLAIELKDEADAPIGNPQPWMAAQPELQRKSDQTKAASEVRQSEETAKEGMQGGEAGNSRLGKDVGGIRTTAVRNVEAGEFRMEVWVEEGRGKDKFLDGGARGMGDETTAS